MVTAAPALAQEAGPAAAQRQKAEAEVQKAQAEYQRAMDAERLLLDERRVASDPAHRAFVRSVFQPHTAKMEKVPYCGVATAEVPPALVEQLKLTPGIGLLVDFVEPSSPAEAAGIKQYDVLLKFNDQLLTNAEQLRALVRMRMPSDDVKFALVRRGEATTANVELAEKEMEVLAEGNPAQGPEHFKTYGYGRNGELIVNGNRVGVGAGGGGPGFFGGGGGGMTYTNAMGRNQIVWSDRENTLNVDLRGGKAVKLSAVDRVGKEIFNGPVETDEQRKALPDNLAEKLKKAEASVPLPVLRLEPAKARSRVVTSSDKDTLLVARIENGKATHAFAFSTADGKTLFDGPTADDAQRKGMPEAVAKQLDVLEKNVDAAAEFGVVGRNGF
jgi:hypothetical protein